MRSSSSVPVLPDDAPRWAVGDAVVHRIDEVILPPETGPWLLPSATPQLVERAPWLTPSFADEAGNLHIAVHTFAIEIDGLRVLVDTGIGNRKTRANPAWHDLRTSYLDRLIAAGFEPEAVDLVILTHLHTDHVGWNTVPGADGGWRPTFPSARYLTSRREYDYWAGAELEGARRTMFEDSVHPVRDAGLLDLTDVPADGAEVIPGVTLVPAPGHTPGQVSVEITSAGERAVITGDCVHHPVQLAHPGVVSSADVDTDQAARTRHDLLARLADTDTLLFGSHFAPPTAGLVRTDGDAYRLDPVPGHHPAPRTG